MDTFSQSYSHFPHHRQKNFGVENPTIDYQIVTSIPLAPFQSDMAIIVTDEEGIIEFCNTKAQCLFHCSMSCAQNKKLYDLCTLIYSSNAYNTPTLCEIAHISRRPLSLLNLKVSTLDGKYHQMDICILWLNELHEGHFRIAFFFLPALNLQKKIFSYQRTYGKLSQHNPSENGIEEGVVLHRNHLILRTSAALNAMSGYEEKELIGQDISLLMTDTSAAILRHTVKLHDTTAWSGLLIQRNKFLIPVEIQSFPLLHLYSDAVITRLRVLADEK